MHLHFGFTSTKTPTKSNEDRKKHKPKGQTERGTNEGRFGNTSNTVLSTIKYYIYFKVKLPLRSVDQSKINLFFLPTTLLK